MSTKLINNLTFWGIISVAFGVFISVSVPSLFHILTIIPAIIINYRLFKEKNLYIPKSAWMLIGIVLLGYVSNFVNFNELNDPLRSFGKLKYFIFAVLSIGLFRVVFENSMDEFKIKKILNVLFFAVGLAAVYGIAKAYPDRAGGFTGIMRYGYGTSLVLTLFIGALFYQGQLSKYFNKKMFYTALILGLSGLLMSKVRGGLLGLIVSLPLIFGLYRRKLGLISLAVVFILLSAFSYVLYSGGSKDLRLLSKLGSMSNLKRLSQYEASSKTIQNNPIFGVGVNNFSSLCPEIKKDLNIRWQSYCEKYPFFNCKFWFKKSSKRYCGHSHNIILETAVNMGVLAGVMLVLWGAFWLYELWHMGTIFSKLMIPFVINMFVAGQFENIFDANNSFMIFLLYPLSFVTKLKGDDAS